MDFVLMLINKLDVRRTYAIWRLLIIRLGFYTTKYPAKFEFFERLCLESILNGEKWFAVPKLSGGSFHVDKLDFPIVTLLFTPVTISDEKKQ